LCESEVEVECELRPRALQARGALSMAGV